MKILFYLYKYCYPPVGGTHTRAFYLARELSRQHDIFLVAHADEDIAAGDIDKMKPFCREIHVLPPRKKSAPALFLKSMLTGIPYKVLCYDSGPAHELLHRLVKERGIDLLLMDYVFLANSCVLDLPLKKCLLAPNLEFLLLRRYMEHGSLLRKLYGLSQWKKLYRYEIETCSRLDLTVFVSESDRKIMLGSLPGIPSAVAEGVMDTEYLRSRRSGRPSSREMIYAGAMWYYPNIEAVRFMAESVFPLVKKSVPEARFTVVGEKPSRYVRSLSRIDGIDITGWVKDVRPYMDRSLVYVVPLSIGSGIRSKILEAMAMNIPVVSTTIGCEGLDVSNGRNILIADKPEDFAEAVVKLMTDTSLWDRISREGREFVESRHSCRVVGKKLNEAISRLA